MRQNTFLAEQAVHTATESHGVAPTFNLHLIKLLLALVKRRYAVKPAKDS